MSDPGYPKLAHTSNYYSGDWYNSHGDHTAHYEYPVYYDNYGADKYSTKTPGWPRVIRDNPYYRSGWTRKVSPSQWTGYTDSGDHGSGTEPVFETNTIPNSWGENADELAIDAYAAVLTKMQSKIKNQQVNASVALAEAHQTADLLVSTCNTLASTVNALRRGNVKGAILNLTGSRPSRRSSAVVQNAGGVPQQWLALQYGWRPLLSDVYGASQALSDRLSEKPAFCHVRESSSRQAQGSLTQTSAFKGLKIRWTHTVSAHVSGFIEWSVGNSFAAMASSTGISNPASVIWEKLPWSFVVDWFLPVGTFLNNLDYASGLEFHRGWISTKLVSSANATIADGKADSSGVHQNYTGGSDSIHGESYEREVLGSFPAVPLPRLKNPLSLTHVANALSLLATAFRG